MANTPKCDVTGKELNLNEGNLIADTRTGQWFFCSPGAEGQIPNHTSFPLVERIHDQAAFIDLLSQVGTKSWFDAQQFFAKINSLKPY